MLASLSRTLRLVLVLMLGIGYVAWDGHRKVAHADDEEEGGGGGGEEGDDDGKPSKGDDDDTPGDDDDDDAGQPAVTAGGLYTLKTYPVSELLRPLTITQNIAQATLGVGTDVSNKGAFTSAGVNLDALFGYTDNFMLLGGLDSTYNFNGFQVYGGFEGALAYDLLDLRVAMRIGRAAFSAIDPMDPDKVLLDHGGIKASVDIGFPFRYQAKKEIAIIALNTLMSVDFNGVEGNGAKPDLNPSLGIATNPVPQLSLVIFAQLQAVDFDFSNNLVVPATARVQFSPNQKFDIGAMFTLLNIKAEKPFDNRFLTLYIASRFGK